MTDFIAAKDGTVTRDPGQAIPDSARRPGQPGAERPQVDQSPATEQQTRTGEIDERGERVDEPIGEQVAAEPDPMEADLHEEAPTLSDGSVRAGPV
jgi:hypothetical protein